MTDADRTHSLADGCIPPHDPLPGLGRSVVLEAEICRLRDDEGDQPGE